MVSVSTILSTVEKTNSIISRIERQEEQSNPINLFLRREIISDYLRELDQRKNDQNVPNIIRRGDISGLLGHTAGLGAVPVAGVGPLIITGKLGNRIRVRGDGNVHQLLEEIGFSMANIRNYFEKLRKKSILLIIISPTSPQQVVQIIRRCGGQNVKIASKLARPEAPKEIPIKTILRRNNFNFSSL